MSKCSKKPIKLLALGTALGVGVGIMLICVLKPKKPPVRRKAEHAIKAIGAIMQSVSDFIM